MGKKVVFTCTADPLHQQPFSSHFFSCSWFFGSCRERLRRAGRTKSNHLGQIRPSGKTSTVVTHLLGWIEISDFTRDFLEGFPYTKTTGMYSFGVTGASDLANWLGLKAFSPDSAQLFRKWKQISPLQIDSKPQKFQLRVKVWLSEPLYSQAFWPFWRKLVVGLKRPTRKICASQIISKVWGENNTHLKPPPSWGLKNKLKKKIQWTTNPTNWIQSFCFLILCWWGRGKCKCRTHKRHLFTITRLCRKLAGKPKTIPKNIPKSSCLDDDFLLYILAWCQRCLCFPFRFPEKKTYKSIYSNNPQVNPSKQVMVFTGWPSLANFRWNKNLPARKAPGATWLKIAWPQNSASGNNGNWWVRWWAYTYPRNPVRELGIIYWGSVRPFYLIFQSWGHPQNHPSKHPNIITSFRHVAVQEISELIFDKILQQAPLFPSLLHLQIFYCQHVWSKFPKSNSSFLGASCSPQCFLVRCQFEELRKELTGLARFELQPPGLRLRRNTKSIWGASCNKLQLIQRLGK